MDGSCTTADMLIGTKTTQDKRDYEEQKCEKSLSEDCWNAKIAGMRRFVENECRSPEGTKFRRMNGAKQK